VRRLSLKNPRIADLRSLARQRRARAESHRFIIEGPKLIEEALRVGIVLDAVYVDEAALRSTASRRVEDVLDLVTTTDVEVWSLGEGALNKVSTSSTPQPMLAVAQSTPKGIEFLEDLLPAPTFVLVAVDINDPGNMGTVTRTAVAAGADAVVVLGQSVDVWSPKVVRSSAGSIFHVRMIVEPDTETVLEMLGDAELHRLALAGTSPTPVHQADLTQPIALIVGSEAHGLPEGLDRMVDQWVSIPMHGPTESLNVAMAATIASYETLRQRMLASETLASYPSLNES